MIVDDEIVLPVLKWDKTSKRIIEIIASSGLHWDKKKRGCREILKFNPHRTK